jgi:hypothetical protein
MPDLNSSNERLDTIFVKTSDEDDEKLLPDLIIEAKK